VHYTRIAVFASITWSEDALTNLRREVRFQHRVRRLKGTAMEPDETPGEGTAPIEYEAPQVLEQVDIEAQLAVISG
jgi:hypothetical protein